MAKRKKSKSNNKEIILSHLLDLLVGLVLLLVNKLLE